MDGRPSIDYDEIAQSYATYREPSPTVLEHLAQRFSRQDVGALLEVGCGTADYLAVLAERMKVPGFGLDKSAEMLSLARQRHPDLVLKHADAEETFPFDEESIDACFSVNLMHYLDNHRALFRQAYRVGRPGAVVVSVTDCEQDIRRRTICRYFPETLRIELDRYPALSEIATAMEETGWGAVEYTQTDRTFPLDPDMLEKIENKAYSALRLIPPDRFGAGIARLKNDLAQGQVTMRESYTYVWGKKHCDD